jgi:hypothetical protein
MDDVVFFYLRLNTFSDNVENVLYRIQVW